MGWFRILNLLFTNFTLSAPPLPSTGSRTGPHWPRRACWHKDRGRTWDLLSLWSARRQIVGFLGVLLARLIRLKMAAADPSWASEWPLWGQRPVMGDRIGGHERGAGRGGSPYRIRIQEWALNSRNCSVKLKTFAMSHGAIFLKRCPSWPSNVHVASGVCPCP